MATTLTLSSNAVPACIRPLRNIVASAAHDSGLPDSKLYALKLCVSEALTNVVKHAYLEGEPGRVEVTIDDLGDELSVAIADHGQGHRAQRWQERGGFGLAFVYRLTDGCTFTAGETGTTVEMLFPLSRGGVAHSPESIGRRVI